MGSSSAMKAMNRTIVDGLSMNNSLQPINERKSSKFVVDKAGLLPYPKPSAHVMKKFRNTGKKDASMVLVMNNMMTKRRTGGAKRGKSKPHSEVTGRGSQYHQNDFYC